MLLGVYTVHTALNALNVSKGQNNVKQWRPICFPLCYLHCLLSLRGLLSMCVKEYKASTQQNILNNILFVSFLFNFDETGSIYSSWQNRSVLLVKSTQTDVLKLLQIQGLLKLTPSLCLVLNPMDKYLFKHYSKCFVCLFVFWQCHAWFYFWFKCCTTVIQRQNCHCCYKSFQLQTKVMVGVQDQFLIQSQWSF